MQIVGGVTGAIAGAVAGHFLFLWIARQGFYALALPGAATGLAGGFWLKRSSALGVFCGVLGLAVGLFSEWRFAPFTAEGSLGYFLTHLHQLRPVTWIMILLGAGLGYWFGRGRTRAGRPDA
jgi:hypothetical protein